MRLFFFFFTMNLTAQISSMTFGSPNNYSNQLNGSNGMANNGNFTDHDTTRATWCAWNVLVTGNDGFGPQSILNPSGRATFITVMTDFTIPAAGVTQTLLNGFSAFGTSSQDIYSNGNTIKSSGIICFNNVITIFTQQQFSFSNPQHGSLVNAQRSFDG